ncbi:MAG: hypothetical protein EXS13_07235, partial [Planctomycetes bacterium]|nr:hypothetical protein [Planctomycetota bacterium]
MQLVYRGLVSTPDVGWYHSPERADDVDGTRRQLTELMAGKQRFALIDPIALIDLERLREHADPRVARIAASIAVDHGDCFRDERGRWCAWQHLHSDHVTELVALGSELLREALVRQREIEARDGMLELLLLDDAESRLRQRPALAAPFAWLALRGRTLALRLPASERSAQELSRRIAAASDWQTIVEAIRRTVRSSQQEPDRAVAAA